MAATCRRVGLKSVPTIYLPWTGTVVTTKELYGVTRAGSSARLSGRRSRSGRGRRVPAGPGSPPVVLRQPLRRDLFGTNPCPAPQGPLCTHRHGPIQAAASLIFRQGQGIRDLLS